MGRQLYKSTKKCVDTDGNTDTTETQGNRSTDTAAAESGGNTPDSAGRTKEKEVVSEIPILVLPNGESVKSDKKPRKQRQTKKNENSFDSSQLTMLLLAMSAVVAGRENFQHWALSESEAKQISEPLAKVIEKSSALSKLTDNADSIALVMACLVVFMPRLFITFQNVKKNKTRKEVVKDERKIITGSKESVEHNVNRPTSSNEDYVANNVTTIPAIM